MTTVVPPAEKSHKLWGGRFAGGPSAEFDALNNSIGVDFRLWPFDIQLSKAWAMALYNAGVLTLDELHEMERGLDAVHARLSAGEQPAPPDEDLAEGDELTVGATTFSVLHTPGHAPGHVIFVGPGLILGGDLLFQGSIGRTDLPYSDGSAMEASLARIAALPGALAVFPGHGPATTIAQELADNPFLNGTVLPVHR